MGAYFAISLPFSEHYSENPVIGDTFIQVALKALGTKLTSFFFCPKKKELAAASSVDPVGTGSASQMKLIQGTARLKYKTSEK